MKCPKCVGKLEKNSIEDVEVDRCFVCEGIWFDKGELDEVLERDSRDIHFKDAGREEFDGKEVVELIKDLDLKAGACPRCQDGTLMVKKEFRGKHVVVGDVCPKGHGIWLDGGELEGLRKRGFAKFRKMVEYSLYMLKRAYSKEGINDIKERFTRSKEEKDGS